MSRLSYNVYIPHNEIKDLRAALNQASFNPRIENLHSYKLDSLSQSQVIQIRVKVFVKGQPQRDLVAHIINAHNGSIITSYPIGHVLLSEKVEDFFRRIWLTIVVIYLGTVASIFIYNYQSFIEGKKSTNEILYDVFILLLICFIPAIAAGLTELKESH